MGKRIIVQARGHGSPTYRVRKRAFRFRLQYPSRLSGEGVVIKLFNSSAHSSPLAKIKYDNGFFYMPAFKGMIEGQKISFEGKEIKEGNILRLKDIPVKMQIYNIESRPGDGGIFIKSAGNSAVINKVVNEKIFVMMPSKKEKAFNQNCRAVVGTCAGTGRFDKPLIKAGKQFYIKKAKSKLWPRTSAVKMNVIDHPFGSGRGKRIKSKIAKRNAPPGARVGLIRPKRTGKRK
ncbi:50S ribosomal protein L2 [Candidatus Pacearchaeota archaeon CG10_big_fil_rev_8_21_14_0_10_32_42]|nr:MAG: 50S ribosomal protein L2 [Candidatus Pacearchaeota archaeon CG10_big_fil_rev_8_21_14_0_10_32_42]